MTVRDMRLVSPKNLCLIFRPLFLVIFIDIRLLYQVETLRRNSFSSVMSVRLL